MRRVTPTEFRDAFVNVVQVKAMQLYDQWMQHNDTDYTAFIRREILPAIAEQLRLLVWCRGDYFHLDAVLYEEKDSEHFRPNETWVKAVAVAIEHENASGPGTYREMNKLQLFNAPLKVLIAYTRDDKQAEALLKQYGKIIRDADTFDDIATLRRQLVIFGDLPRQGRRWTFHAYEPTDFAALAEVHL
jgi:hypothetical protein